MDNCSVYWNLNYNGLNFIRILKYKFVVFKFTFFNFIPEKTEEL